MEDVVVSQWLLFEPELASSSQIIVGALALTIRPVFETFAERLKSVSAAFHNQNACNGVSTSSVYRHVNHDENQKTTLIPDFFKSVIKVVVI
jgi:hypothetical protein